MHLPVLVVFCHLDYSIDFDNQKSLEDLVIIDRFE